MRTKHVVVLPYNEKWKQDFMTIKEELSAALGDIAIAIEHVGSTSVEGMAAKPIIDIDVAVKRERIGDAILALSDILSPASFNLSFILRSSIPFVEK